MAISLKTAGTWARLVTDGTVTIPGTPAAGDRMFLFATWKNFAITVTNPNGWTPIGTEFADGAVTAAANVGSVKVMAWYRDWQSGDTNPTIDWSSNPTEGHVVIMLWQKGASESWDAPLTATAAIAAADPFSATASSTVDIKDGSVVMCLIGLRDDSSTLARTATTAIEDDGSPNVTWNGNYVESPATHFSTTTGQDMSGDLGHRFVTTGANGVNLTTTGNPAAAESGAAKWVVQSVSSVTVKEATAVGSVSIAAFGQAPQGYTPVRAFGQVSVASTVQDASWKGQPAVGNLVVASTVQSASWKGQPAVGSMVVVASSQTAVVRGQPAVGSVVVSASGAPTVVKTASANASVVVASTVQDASWKGQPSFSQIAVAATVQDASWKGQPAIGALVVASMSAVPVLAKTGTAVGTLVVAATVQDASWKGQPAVGTVRLEAVAQDASWKGQPVFAQVVVATNVQTASWKGQPVSAQVAVAAHARTASWKGQPAVADVKIASTVVGDKQGFQADTVAFAQLQVAALASAVVVKQAHAQAVVSIGSTVSALCSVAGSATGSVYILAEPVPTVRLKTAETALPSAVYIQAEGRAVKVATVSASGTLQVQSLQVRVDGYAVPSAFGEIAVVATAVGVAQVLAQSFVNVSVIGTVVTSTMKTGTVYAIVSLEGRVRTEVGVANPVLAVVAVEAWAQGGKVRRSLRPIKLVSSSVDSISSVSDTHAAGVGTIDTGNITGSYVPKR